MVLVNGVKNHTKLTRKSKRKGRKQSRKGRKQSRKGRKQSRKGRKQSRRIYYRKRKNKNKTRKGGTNNLCAEKYEHRDKNISQYAANKYCEDFVDGANDCWLGKCWYTDGQYMEIGGSRHPRYVDDLLELGFHDQTQRRSTLYGTPSFAEIRRRNVVSRERISEA